MSLLGLDLRTVRGRKGRLGPRSLLAARDPLQAPDLLDVRHEYFVFRNAGRLRGDRVGVDAEQGKLVAAEGIRPRETGHQIAVFGRIGSRPLSLKEAESLYLDSNGQPWFAHPN